MHIRTAACTPLILLALVGCSGSGQEDQESSPSPKNTVSSEPSPTKSARPKSASPSDVNSSMAPSPVTEESSEYGGSNAPLPSPAVTTGVSQQEQGQNSGGYVGPSDEYYSYEGYVEPGFEYQVGTECFDPALGRCKMSGEIQAEHFSDNPFEPQETAEGFPWPPPEEIDGLIHDGNGCYVNPETGNVEACI